MASHMKVHEQRVEYVMPPVIMIVLATNSLFSELRKQIEKAREDTADFREKEKEAHLLLQKLQEEEKLLQMKKKKVHSRQSCKTLLMQIRS